MADRSDVKTLIRILRQTLPLLAEKYQVESLGVFESYVRCSRREDSDLDLLVTFREPPSLLKFMNWRIISPIFLE
jgi:predicted nucleotidyltransferase